MKKILLIALLMFSTIATFAQSSGPTYLRAYKFTMGQRASKGADVTWTVDGRDVNILIELYTTKVVINSKTKQSYHIINQVFDEPGNNVVWKCKDADGLTCYIKMGFDAKYPELVAFHVEYDDILWFYICTKD